MLRILTILTILTNLLDACLQGIMETIVVRERLILRNPILFSVSQRPSVPYQFLENRNEQIYTQFSGLRS